MELSWQTDITPQYRDRKRLELVVNFQPHIKIDGQDGPVACARLLEEKAFQTSHCREEYDQKISQFVELSQNNHDQYEKLLARCRGLTLGGGSSRPRAGEPESSSFSTMNQAGTQLHPMNHPMNQAPGLGSPPQQQAQQQNQVPVQIQQAQLQIQQAQLQNTLEPATQDPDITGVSPVEIERNKVFKKLKYLNEKYLQDMNELYIMLTHRSNQPMPAEQLQKLKHYKDVLHRMIPYLRVPKERVPKEFNMEKVEAFEKQITSIMDTFKRRRNPQPEVGNVARAVHAQPEVDNGDLVIPAQREAGNGAPSEVQVN